MDEIDKAAEEYLAPSNCPDYGGWTLRETFRAGAEWATERERPKSERLLSALRSIGYDDGEDKTDLRMVQIAREAIREYEGEGE